MVSFLPGSADAFLLARGGDTLTVPQCLDLRRRLDAAIRGDLLQDPDAGLDTLHVSGILGGFLSGQAALSLDLLFP